MINDITVTCKIDAVGDEGLTTIRGREKSDSSRSNPGTSDQKM